MMFSEYPPQKFDLCCNKLMVIFAALKYIRKSLGSYLFSEQMKYVFQKGVDIYIQRLFSFCSWARKMHNSWLYRPYLLCMKIMVRRSGGIRSGNRMSHLRYSQLWQLWMKGEVRGLSGADSSIKIGGDFHGTHSKGSIEHHCSWLGSMVEHR